MHKEKKQQLRRHRREGWRGQHRVPVEFLCKFLSAEVWGDLPEWQQQGNLKWFRENLRVLKNEGLFLIPNLGCMIQKHGDGTVTVKPTVKRVEGGLYG